MKLCVKTLLLIILVLLVPNCATAATSAPISSSDNDIEVCILSQAPTTQQLLNDIYKHISSQAICLDVVDTILVPGNKVIRLLATNCPTLHSFSKTQDNTHLFHLQPMPNDPLGYYIYGLRRILI